MPAPRSAPRPRPRSLLVTALGIVSVLVLAACGGSSGSSGSRSGAIPAGPIKLAAILSLSGSGAVYGGFQQKLYQLSAQLINQAGGIDGHQIDMEIKNDQSDPTVGVQQALQLASENVAGVVYTGLPNVEQQTLPILTKEKIPTIMLDPSSWTTAEKYPYFFTDYMTFAQEGAALADAAKADGQKVAVIIDDSLTAQGIQSGFTDRAKQIGLDVTANITYSSNAIDVSSQVSQAKNSGATGVVVFPDSGYEHVWDAMRSLSWSPKIYATDIARDNGFDAMQALAANAVTTCVEPMQVSGQPLDPTVAKAQQAAMQQIKGVPDAVFATFAKQYESVLAFKAVIEQTHTLDPNAIKAALEKWTNKVVLSASDPLTFTPTNHHGQPTSQIFMCPMASHGDYGVDERLAAK